MTSQGLLQTPGTHGQQRESLPPSLSHDLEHSGHHHGLLFLEGTGTLQSGVTLLLLSVIFPDLPDSQGLSLWLCFAYLFFEVFFLKIG